MSSCVMTHFNTHTKTEKHVPTGEKRRQEHEPELQKVGVATTIGRDSMYLHHHPKCLYWC